MVVAFVAWQKAQQHSLQNHVMHEVDVPKLRLAIILTPTFVCVCDLSQLPHVLWASGCWHYERTLYSRRPLKGTGVSIYLYVIRCVFMK
jgi:hypothetical protein